MPGRTKPALYKKIVHLKTVRHQNNQASKPRSNSLLTPAHEPGLPEVVEAILNLSLVHHNDRQLMMKETFEQQDISLHGVVPVD